MYVKIKTKFSGVFEIFKIYFITKVVDLFLSVSKIFKIA